MKFIEKIPVGPPGIAVRFQETELIDIIMELRARHHALYESCPIRADVVSRLIMSLQRCLDAR